jgi:hypothetical protein
MAYSTTSWFNNGIQGIPGVGADVDIFETVSSPNFAVGTRFTRSDGCEFVYAHFGAAVTFPGLIVGQDISESSTANAGSRLLASASCTAIAGETIKPNTVGSHYVQCIGGGISVDQFAGGYFHTTKGDGGFYQYRIRGNTASAQLTSGAKLTYYIELYEPLQQTLSTIQTTNCRILGSQYTNLESCLAGTDGLIGGVTTCSHAASTYGWVQTKGLALIRGDASYPNLGSVAALSNVKAGCVCYIGKKVASQTGRNPIIGFGVQSCIAAAAYGQAIMLNL